MSNQRINDPLLQTAVITLNLGDAGEESVDVICKWVEGERGSREDGRQMEPDWPDSWEVVAIESGQPCLGGWLRYRYKHDDDFADIVDDLVKDEME